jgi:hypothetical protein
LHGDWELLQSGQPPVKIELKPLRDLQTYLKLSSLSHLDKESRKEQEQI